MADLAYLLLLINTMSAVLVALREFLRRGGYVTLPFLTSTMFLSWYLPQAWTLMDYPGLAHGSLVRLFFMSLLCFWALVLGWRRGLVGGWRRPQPLVVPMRRLFIPVFAITLFAMAMRLLIEMQPTEVRTMGQWTGIITIIAFFASVSVVSMALSIAMLLTKRTWTTITLFALNLSIYLPLIFIYFRRSDMFEFMLATLLGLLFARGRVVPRAGIVGALVAGLFLVNGIGQLRALSGAYHLGPSGTIETRLPTLREIVAIDWFSTLDHRDRIDRSEVMNAAIGLQAVAYHGTFTAGAQFWNRLVHAYVPGQFVGHELKRDLMLGDHALEIARSELYFDKHTGTTATGFLAPYQDFWFVGCLVWWLTGYVMGRFMHHALNGSLIAYTLYAATITNAILVTTHFGYHLFSQSFLILLAVIFVRFWLRRSARSARGRFRDEAPA